MQRLLLILTGLGLALLIVLGSLLLTFDPADYKDDVAARLSAAIGREVNLPGEISLRPSLTPALVVEGLSIANAAWAEHANLLEVARFEARMRLISLLSRRLEFVAIKVEGVTLNLETTADEVNWTLATPDPAQAEKTKADAASAAPIALNIDHISVRDLTLRYRAPQAEPLKLTADRMELLPNGFGQPLKLRARLQLNDRPIHVGAQLAPLSTLFANEPFDLDLRVTVDEARVEILGQIARPLDATGIGLTITGHAPARMFGPSIERRVPARAALTLTTQLRDDAGAYLLEDLLVEFDKSDISGNVRVQTDGQRPEISADLRAKTLDLNPFQGEPAEADDTGPVFSPEPLQLDALHAANIDLKAHVGTLRLPTHDLTSVALNARLDDSVLSIDGLEARAIDGRIDLQLELDASSDAVALEQRLVVTDLPASALLAEKAARALRGGRLDLDIAIESHGVSAATLAANSDGHVTAFLRDAELTNDTATAATGDIALGLFNSINPLSNADPNTRIACAVINFPLNQGRLQSDTGIGIMTGKLGILGGGTIDLGKENLNLKLSPKPREGIGLNLASLAEFIHIGGTLRDPRPVTDAEGMALAGLKVGAAVATAGLSVLAEGALDRADGDRDVCAIARGEASIEHPDNKPAISRAAESAGDTLKKAGGAIRDTFKNLFD